MKKAVVIGSGFGGLAIAIRLQHKGVQTTVLEKRDKAGGRAYVIEEEGFKFDCGPTIITAPYLMEELFELCGKKAKNYYSLTPLSPYYRVYFEDKTYFDYSGDIEHQKKEVERIDPDDVGGYERFVKDTNKILKRGYIELGDYAFQGIWDMIKIAPDLIGLDVIKDMYSFASKYFKNEHLRRVFSFHSLLIGGNPLNVSAIYALIPALERRWGVHFAMGGTGALINALLRLFTEIGGKIMYRSEVSEIVTKASHASAVNTKKGAQYLADIVVSNAGFAHTYKDLISENSRKVNTNKKILKKHYSMSAFVLFFGFKKTAQTDLLHHNIILSKHYKELLNDIFKNYTLSDEFSQYLHIPTITDPNLAPNGCHAAYTLIPVPNLTARINWTTERNSFETKIIDFLDKHYIKELKKNLVFTKSFTPLDFKSELNAFLGTGWGVEPRLTQSASFRPHNRSEDIKNLYLVGASTQPGAGVPGVLTTAKITDKLITEDFQLA